MDEREPEDLPAHEEALPEDDVPARAGASTDDVPESEFAPDDEDQDLAAAALANGGAEAGGGPPPAGDRIRPTTAWAGLIVSVGLGVAVVQVLYFLFTLAQGLSVRRHGAGSLSGDFFHRIGIAFSRSLSPIQGLALVLAVALVSIPAVADVRLPARMDRRRVVTLYIVAAIAILIGLGTALGVRAELHLDEIQQTPTTPFRRWALATDVVGTLGTALVAFLAALAAFPDRRRRSR